MILLYSCITGLSQEKNICTLHILLKVTTELLVCVVNACMYQQSLRAVPGQNFSFVGHIGLAFHKTNVKLGVRLC